MSWTRKLLRTFDPKPLDTALDDELRFHIEQRTNEYIAQGMSPVEARRQAALLFGNRTALRESTRDRDVLVWLETTLQDVRYALRGMRHRPGFTCAAVLSLALGIGANTAIFTLLDQVLLRNLPVRHPEQLVQLKQTGMVYGMTFGDDSFSYPLYKDLSDRNQAFSGVIGQFPVTLSVAFGSHTERVEGELVSGNYFDVLGVGAALGRTIAPQDDVKPGGHPLAVLAYDYWLSRFSGDPEVVGRTIIVDGLPLTIVGVSRKGFDGITLGHPVSVRIPLAMKGQMTQGMFAEEFNLVNRRAYWVEVFARLKPGMATQQAQASLQPLLRSLLEMEVREKGFEKASSHDKEEFLKGSVALLPASRGKSQLREYEAPLRILMAIVGVVLLIACANVANLLLARSAARQGEMALRLAIGASFGRVVRQMLVECLLLSIAGGAAGLLLATWMDRLLLRFLTSANNLTATPDLRVLGFTLAVCVITGLLFGLAPAWAARGIDVAPTLKVDHRSAGNAAVRFRGALVVVQVSLCVLLLVVASQFVRSLVNLRGVNVGLRTQNVLEFAVNPSMNGYGKERSAQFYRALMEKLRHVPEIQSAGASAVALLDQGWWSPAITLDFSGPQTGEDNPNADLVSRGYFATLGIPLELGRDFSAADAHGKQRIVVVNQAFVRRYCGGRNPVGHRLGLGNEPGTPTDLEIVGVVRDSKFYDVRQAIRPLIYFDNDQNSDIQQINVYLRSSADSRRVFASIKQAVASLDPAVPPFAMRTLEEQEELTLARDRMVTTLASIFGVVAVLLAAIGIYGLMAFNVARRTREIAVRMALGADGRMVTWMVLREVLALAAAGIAVALPAAWVLMGLVQSELFGVQPHDPVSLWMAPAILAAVALLAGYLPVRRVAAIEPMAALRTE